MRARSQRSFTGQPDPSAPPSGDPPAPPDVRREPPSDTPTPVEEPPPPHEPNQPPSDQPIGDPPQKRPAIKV